MSEPMYDDEFLEYISEYNKKDLVRQIWQYTLSLEDYIISLRKQINALYKNRGLGLPFPDPASDFAIRFYGHSAYDEFSEVLVEEPKDKITD